MLNDQPCSHKFPWYMCRESDPVGKSVPFGVLNYFTRSNFSVNNHKDVSIRMRGCTGGNLYIARPARILRNPDSICMNKPFLGGLTNSTEVTGSVEYHGRSRSEG